MDKLAGAEFFGLSSSVAPRQALGDLDEELEPGGRVDDDLDLLEQEEFADQNNDDTFNNSIVQEIRGNPKNDSWLESHEKTLSSSETTGRMKQNQNQENLIDKLINKADKLSLNMDVGTKINNSFFGDVGGGGSGDMAKDLWGNSTTVTGSSIKTKSLWNNNIEDGSNYSKETQQEHNKLLHLPMVGSPVHPNLIQAPLPHMLSMPPMISSNAQINSKLNNLNNFHIIQQHQQLQILQQQQQMLMQQHEQQNKLQLQELERNRLQKKRIERQRAEKYKDLMTYSDKGFVKKVQLSQVFSVDPLEDDFYYYMYTKNSGPRFNIQNSYNKNQQRYNNNQNQNQVHRNNYINNPVEKEKEKEKEKQMEGSLGSILKFSIHKPKSVIEVGISTPGVQCPSLDKVQDVDNSNMDMFSAIGGNNQRTLLLSIERGFKLLLTLDDQVRRQKLSLPDKRKLNDTILDFFGLNIDKNEIADGNNNTNNNDNVGETVEALNSFKVTGKMEERFLRIMTIEKGQLFLSRAFGYLNLTQTCKFIMVILVVAEKLDRLFFYYKRQPRLVQSIVRIIPRLPYACVAHILTLVFDGINKDNIQVGDKSLIEFFKTRLGKELLCMLLQQLSTSKANNRNDNMEDFNIKVTKCMGVTCKKLVGNYTDIISPPFDMLSWNLTSFLLPFYSQNNDDGSLSKVKQELEVLSQLGAQSDAANVISFVMSSFK